MNNPALYAFILAFGSCKGSFPGNGLEGSVGSNNEPTSSTVISHAGDAAFCLSQLDFAVAQYTQFKNTYTDPTHIPRSAKDNTVLFVSPSDWTSGFVAGSFWLLYEHTNDLAWKNAAETFTNALASQRTRTDTHDIGFIINNSFGQGYRLTGNADYAAVIREAGASLSTRFNSTVGAIRSWNGGSWTYPVIIDNMMNLELLFNANNLGGDETFRSMAITHALTTKKNHFRPDMSSYHVVDYDPSTGAVIKKETNQGISDDSDWARGQAWGLYGFTMSFRETNNNRFRNQALGIADFYTYYPTMPDDGVPYFDFYTYGDDTIPDYRDASAGAIISSALLELARYATPEASERYIAFAVKTIRSLSSSAYRATLGENAYFLLQHSVGNYPQNSEIDVAINYADYYYIEALIRCADLP